MVGIDMDFQRGEAPDQKDVIIGTKLEPCQFPAVPEGVASDTIGFVQPVAASPRLLSRNGNIDGESIPDRAHVPLMCRPTATLLTG